jgi:hypothetical protein
MEDIVKIETSRRKFHNWFQSILVWASENPGYAAEEFIDEKIRELQPTSGMGWIPPKLGNIHRSIITVLLRTIDKQRGLHVNEIFQKCYQISAMSWNKATVKKEIENLGIWGLVYTTISEEHWMTVMENEKQLIPLSIEPKEMVERFVWALLHNSQFRENRRYTIEEVKPHLPEIYSLIDAEEIRQLLMRSHADLPWLSNLGLAING